MNFLQTLFSINICTHLKYLLIYLRDDMVNIS
jgi:hypothetical protein